MKLRSIAFGSVVVAAFVSGCASYYRVTEPGEHRVYYTDKVDQKDNGAIVFKDAATQKNITLQGSEVEKITKEQFETGKAQAAQMPANMSAMPPSTRP
jgi:hypothetical protein